MPPSEITPIIRELIEAAQDVLHGGDHEGPCDNEDIDYVRCCWQHVAAAEHREARLKVALEAFWQSSK